MAEQKQHNVYIYLDPRKQRNFTYGKLAFAYEPFYVGAGGRYRHYPSVHAEGMSPQILIARLKDIGPTNVIVEFALQGTTRAEALRKEKELIAIIGRKDLGKGPLLNQKDDNNRGYHHTVETRRKIGEASKKLERTAEWRRNMSKAQKGIPCPSRSRPCSEEKRRKISESQKGIPRPLTTGEKHPLAKLTADNVLEIRRIATLPEYDRRTTAKEFGVSVTVITNIIKRNTWRHI